MVALTLLCPSEQANLAYQKHSLQKSKSNQLHLCRVLRRSLKRGHSSSTHTKFLGQFLNLAGSIVHTPNTTNPAWGGSSKFWFNVKDIRASTNNRQDLCMEKST
jgi:hypothetical protein